MPKTKSPYIAARNERIREAFDQLVKEFPEKPVKQIFWQLHVEIFSDISPKTIEHVCYPPRNTSGSVNP